MMTRRKAVLTISAVIAGLGAALLGGCGGTRAVFTQPEMFTYQRLAVLGLDLEQEQLFMANYIKAFPGKPINFVERSKLLEILSEQTLHRGRLDPKTRARIKKVFGVEALILCEYYSDEDRPAARKKLRLRVVDSETGSIVGSALTDVYGGFESQARVAIAALKADLLSGSSGSFYEPSETVEPSRR